MPARSLSKAKKDFVSYLMNILIILLQKIALRERKREKEREREREREGERERGEGGGGGRGNVREREKMFYLAPSFGAQSLI